MMTSNDIGAFKSAINLFFSFPDCGCFQYMVVVTQFLFITWRSEAYFIALMKCMKS